MNEAIDTAIPTYSTRPLYKKNRLVKNPISRSSQNKSEALAIARTTDHSAGTIIKIGEKEITEEDIVHLLSKFTRQDSKCVFSSHVWKAYEDGKEVYVAVNGPMAITVFRPYKRKGRKSQPKVVYSSCITDYIKYTTEWKFAMARDTRWPSVNLSKYSFILDAQEVTDKKMKMQCRVPLDTEKYLYDWGAGDFGTVRIRTADDVCAVFSAAVISDVIWLFKQFAAYGCDPAVLMHCKDYKAFATFSGTMGEWVVNILALPMTGIPMEVTKGDIVIEPNVIQ